MDNALKVGFVVTANAISVKINGYTYRVTKAGKSTAYEVLKEQLKDVASDLVEQMDLRDIKAQVDMNANTADTLSVQIKKTVNPAYEKVRERQIRDAIQRMDYNERRKAGTVEPTITLTPYNSSMPLSEQPVALALVEEYRRNFGFKARPSEDYRKIAEVPSRYAKVFGSYSAFKLVALDKTLL